MRAEPTVRLRALAKINLTLRVLARRPDGYHELRTVFQSLALHDTLTCRAREGAFRIECDAASCPIDRTNLVWRAAELVWRAGGKRGQPRDAVVNLEKRIPMAAGLGGGSSDAAAAIRGLARLWRIDLSPARQCAIAASIGADVAFFLNGGTALAVERGDVLFPLIDLPRTWITLVMPPFGVSTADAYGWWDDMQDTEQSARRLGPPRSNPTSASLSLGRPEVAWMRRHLPDSELRNDLERAVVGRHPAIGRLVKALRRLGADHAAMSGSGSAVFALFPRRAAAEAAARAAAGDGCRSLVTYTVNRAQYWRLSGFGDGPHPSPRRANLPAKERFV